MSHAPPFEMPPNRKAIASLSIFPNPVTIDQEAVVFDSDDIALWIADGMELQAMDLVDWQQ